MIELITDRTAGDVLLGNSKGIYSHRDLNRVEQAVLTLSQLVQKLDIHFAPSVKLNWDEPEAFSTQQWPVQSQMQRYLQNVSTLCEKLSVAAELPQSMERLTWEGANQIEQALLTVVEQILSITETFQYSGELFAGEE